MKLSQERKTAAESFPAAALEGSPGDTRPNGQPLSMRCASRLCRVSPLQQGVPGLLKARNKGGTTEAALSSFL